MRSYLDFEKPVGELEQKIEELRAMQASGDVSVADEIERLEAKATQTLAELYENLTPWQKTQVARWPTRPHCLDYVAELITDFTPLAGDRKFGDDEAIVGGFGRFQRRERLRHRPGERLDHREPAQAQFRHGAARRAIARRCG